MNKGAIVVTGLWTGWVPPNDSSTGDLGGSSMSVTNVRVKGNSVGFVGENPPSIHEELE